MLLETGSGEEEWWHGEEESMIKGFHYGMDGVTKMPEKQVLVLLGLKWK